MRPGKCKTQPGYSLTGQVIAAYVQARLIPQDYGGSQSRDFADSTCICLPARSPALRDGGRGIFEQPEKSYLLSDLLELGCEKEDLHERC
jgi:hypothetical protein